MTVVASYNLKGGVGKTASAVNLAWLAAQEGLRTLVWDLDPQGAATYTFRVEPKVRGGAKKLLEERDRADEAIRATDYPNLDLLPADFRYRKMDVLLDGAKKPRQRLRRVLGPVVDDYDLIMLDCPPSLSLTSEAVFELADVLLVPLIPTTLSVRTLRQLVDFVARQGPRDLVVRPFFTLVDGRKKLHAQVMADLPREVPLFLSATVPYASDVERMALERAPLATYAPSSPAAKAYEAVWAELRGTIGGYAAA